MLCGAEAHTQRRSTADLPTEETMETFSTVYAASFLFSHQGQNIWSVAVNESKHLIVSICSEL